MRDEDKTKEQLINELVASRQQVDALRKQADEQLRLQSSALEAAANGIVITDRQGTILWVNPAFTHLTGYTAEEAVGQNPRILYSGEHDQPFYKNLWNTILAGQVWHGQTINRRKDGSLYTEEQIITPVRDARGEITHFIAIKQDVTGRKRAEERIRIEAARADALARVAARLNAHLELDAMLNTVCEETACALDAASSTVAVAVLLHEEARAALVPAATFGLPPEYRELYRPTPRAIYDKYTRQQGPLIVEQDAQAIQDLPNAQLYAHHDIRTIAVASLIRAGQLIGTLNVYTIGEPRTFSDDDLALLQGLADQAAQAIENVRLRHKAQRAAVAAERTRLARDLHDSVTQALYGMTLYAEATARLLSPEHINVAAEQLREMRDTARQALQEMRLLIYELRPPVLQEGGLVAALQSRLDAVEGRADLQTEFEVEVEGRLPPRIEEELYGIAREALNNVLKHAQAHRIKVHLRHQDGRTVVLEIADDGVGFDPPSARKVGGLGLRGIEERAAQLGASLTVESRPGEGTRIRVEVPQ